MSKLDKYFNTRATDKRFKLLHEESSYLTMLKDEAKIKITDEKPVVKEDSEDETGQVMLNESDDLVIDEEDIMEAWIEDTYDPEEINEVSISIVAKTAKKAAIKAAKLKKQRLTPGLTGNAKGKVRMGRL